MKTLTIIGRRWFQRGPGNTYHTAQILIDGKTIHKTSRSYGYGNQFLESAFSYLEANALIPARHRYSNGSLEAPWQLCERLGITFEYSALDVPRQKDL